MVAPPAQAPTRSGFRALDLAGVLALLALASGVIAPALAHRDALRRDEQRLALLRRVQDAIERHHLDTGAWPAGDPATVAGGWDASHDGAFLQVLVARGYLEASVRDPLDDERHHFRYQVFPRGSCACAAAGEFYVLGIRAFETEVFAARRPGGLPCPHRDWSRDMAHVTSGGLQGG